MKNSIKAILIIIGTVIGAGFASGQEINSFFAQYGRNGFYGLCLSNILTSIIIYKILKKADKENINNYKGLIEKSNKTKVIKNLLNNVVNIFLLMSFYIMISGFVTYFYQEFNIPKIITGIIVLVLCYITFSQRIEGISKVNNIIVPILILIIVIFGIKSKFWEGNIINTLETNNKIIWFVKSIEYASYNSILLIPILISIKKYTQEKEKLISITVSIILMILSTILYFILLNFKQAMNTEIPLVTIAGQYGCMYRYAYGIVIIFAIYSTMISAGFGFIENCAIKDNKIIKYICISAIPICYLSFSNLVNITYPVFGLIGLWQIWNILKT